MSVAVVFDLDGTLVDSIPDIHAAVNRMLARIGAVPMPLPEVLSHVGNGAPTLVRRVLASRGVPEHHHASLLAEFLPDYTARSAELTAIYPGVLAALTALAGEGHRLGVCTNKPSRAARAVLDAFDLSRHFAVVIGQGSLAVVKPDPAPLLEAIRLLGGGPALFVGDSEVDLICGQNADVPVALFTEGYLREPGAASLAKHRFSDFADLPAIVRGMA